MMKPDHPFKSNSNPIQIQLQCLPTGVPHPQEFREEAVRYWFSSGQPLKTVAADLGVSDLGVSDLGVSDLGASPECLRSWGSQMDSPVAQAQTTNSTPESAPAATATELTLARGS